MRGSPLAFVFVLALVAACARDHWPADVPVGVSEVHSATVTRDPLPSWAGGAAKQAIIDHVVRTTSPGSASRVPEEDRIAVFDDDGTLKPERPAAEAAFTMARLKAEVVGHPELASDEPYRSILAGDVQKLSSLGREDILSAVARTHSGMTEEAFEFIARGFLADGRHPVLNAPYPTLAYRPMKELLAYLRSRGFSIYLVTGSDQTFARSYATGTFGIPRENIIGSTFAAELVVTKGRADLRRSSTIANINDREAKPVNIHRHIGKRPVIAVGNVGSGGDVAMLTYARGRTEASLALAVLHDDAERELAYDEPDGATLAGAREHGFVVVSMKNDWSQIFDEPRARDATRNQ